MHILENLRNEIAESLTKATNVSKQEALSSLAAPPSPDFGDISSNLAFSLAKEKKTNPASLASEIAKKISKNEFVEKVETKGPYINFFINFAKIAPTLLKEINKDYGKGKAKNKKIMIEYSHPNPCKATHVGNARSTVLGDILSNLLKFDGYDVVKANYYNDMGKQVATAVAAFLHYGKGKEWNPEMYAKFSLDADGNEELQKEIQDIMYKFEIQDDPEVKKLWDKVVKFSIAKFEELYKKLGIKFDTVLYESSFKGKGKEDVEKLVKMGIAAKEPTGETLADLEKFGLGKCVLLRSDGTGLYYVADFAMTKHKFEHFKLDTSIWVVAEQQKLYFQQLFKMLELLGYKWASGCVHLPYGMVLMGGKKMSARAGKGVLFEDAIEMAFEQAQEECSSRYKDLSKKELEKRAEQIGSAAFKYSMTKVSADKAVDFNLDKVVSFEGDTGPYLQYSGVRCKKILEKSTKKPETKTDSIEPAERFLMLKLAEFPEVVENSSRQMKPDIICHYTHSLAEAFNSFYQNCHVIGDKKEAFRLSLVQATLQTLENSLSILGIEVPEAM